MKAVQLVALNEPLRDVDVPAPKLGPADVLINYVLPTVAVIVLWVFEQVAINVLDRFH